jgi:hypothetical protein
MMYYILLPNDTQDSIGSPNNVLGEVSFNSFYADNGFRALRNIIGKHPQLLESIKIFDDTKKQYTVEQFLDTIRDKRLMIN